jgi:hypothetical protein
MKINISDFVQVKAQPAITGQVIELHGNKAVIIDDSSEYEYPDSILEFKINDLQPLES